MTWTTPMLIALPLSVSAIACLWWAWRQPQVDWRLRGLALGLLGAALAAFMHDLGADRGAAIGVLVLVGIGLLAVTLQSLARPAREASAPRPARTREAAAAMPAAPWRTLAGAALTGPGSGAAALYLSVLGHAALQRGGLDAAATLVVAMGLFPLLWALLVVVVAWLPDLRSRLVLLLACLLPSAAILHGA